MVAFLNDNVLDNGLDYIDASNRTAPILHICNAQPTTYTEAVTTFNLGNKTNYATTTGVEDHATSGRQITIDAITDGSVTGTDTATHWAITATDGSNHLIAAQSLSSSQAVTSGNTFTLDEIIIQIPDPTA